MKIGEEIILKEDRKLIDILGTKTTISKKGDRAIMTKNGLRFLDGENRNKLIYEKIDMPKFDVDNISKRIFRNMKYILEYTFDDFLEENGIEESQLIESIVEELKEFI